MSRDPAFRLHEEWLGLCQPTGLVVAPAALLAAQALVDKNIVVEQQALRALVEPSASPAPATVASLPALLSSVLGWQDGDLVEDTAAVQAFDVDLRDYQETLRISALVPGPDPGDKPLMLVKILPAGLDFDDAKAFPELRWQASAQSRFERSLWETEVPIGLLFNGRALRLVYLPRGEISGHVTFPIAPMLEVANRPILSALKMLLGADRVFTLPTKQRLPALLADSRRFQNQVSTELSEQVLSALAELLRGFQAADQQANGLLLQDFRGVRGYGDVYGGLLSVLLRLVFVLYAEDRGLMPDDDVYREGYSVSALYERLRADADAYPDTMDQRYGAWPQLLALFRLVFDGAAWTDDGRAQRLPAREGRLFNPDTHPFLEGRRLNHQRQPGERTDPPRVSDGVVFRVLERLLLLDGQRLSYRTLNVEEIGSVYEGLMGFTVEVAAGLSAAVLPHHVVLDLEALLAGKPAERQALLDEAKCKLSAKQQAALKAAKTTADVCDALGSKLSRRMPLLPPGALYLQPTDERRRSGSHYTPRALTEPIVKTALRPILERLEETARGPDSVAGSGLVTARGETSPKNPLSLGSQPSPKGRGGGEESSIGVSPLSLGELREPRERGRRFGSGEVSRITPEQLLALKICDPAMGSGAFLVEACRQLGELLVDAWARTGRAPKDIPPDETPLLHAKRLIATSCLYGVDKNPFAVELAKLSLWLDTLAKDHAFTFLDHALREGDSLVGVRLKNLTSFDWDSETDNFTGQAIIGPLARVQANRAVLTDQGDSEEGGIKRRAFERAEQAAADLRLLGDVLVAAFFSTTKDKGRREKRADVQKWVLTLEAHRDDLRAFAASVLDGERPMRPFHWDVEFPEVFDISRGGFDVVVGNPPFAGKNTLIAGSHECFPDWLKQLHGGVDGKDAHGNADLVAHFFRRSFDLLRSGGTFGLIATNTIAQGDTRGTGLRPITNNGGRIYSARRRFKWPGLASVVVSLIHVRRTLGTSGATLDGRPVGNISAFLFSSGGNEDPVPLTSNRGKSFQGAVVLGMGFTFDDNTTEASSIIEMHRLIADDPRNQERIFPFIGGDEINSSPSQTAHRYVINFGNLSEEAAWEWPALMRILDQKVKPIRARDNRASYRNWWWQFAEKRSDLTLLLNSMKRVTVASLVSKYLSFSIIKSDQVFSHKLCVIADDRSATLSVLQGRVHEGWARIFSSTMRDDLNYSPSDCFETFPFPAGWETNAALDDVGRRYHDFRAALMVKNNEGLTKTYNRFHDPDHDGEGIEGRDPHDVVADIVALRALHDEMDRCVLDAYGWSDLRPACTFLLDYEEEDDDDAADPAPAARRKKKKPWRWRWPDEVRDEVLARLLELNKQRAEAERLHGDESRLQKDVAFALSAPEPKKPAKKKAAKKATT